MPRPAYPSPLKAGDCIVVTAPSSGVPPPLHARLELVLAHLRGQGFVVEEGRCLRAEVRSASAPANERAAELMQHLLRDDIAAVFPPWGGELAIELLNRLDWQALRHARPKWLIGYSDTSTLMLPITLLLGWATAHGPCLMDLVDGQDDPLTSAALGQLRTPPGASFEQRQSDRWQSKWTDFALVPDTTYQLSEPTHWSCLNRPADQSQLLRGRLIGGCIDTLMHIAGTRHGDVMGYVAGNPEGTIVYLENAEQSPTCMVRALHRLHAAGWLDSLAGLLIGRSAAPDTTQPDALRYHEALTSSLGHVPYPVLIDVDIGHLPPQLLLINGAMAEVTWNESNGGKVAQALN